MQVNLYCPKCACLFSSAPDSPAAEVLDRMHTTGPWYGLGDGQTFEDMIFSALTERGAIRCPECGSEAEVSEESLGQAAMTMLAHW